VGALFSLGHGVVVTAAALIIGSGLLSSHIPQWFEGLGKGISLFFLLFFGALTLWSVFFSMGAAQVPLGIKSFLAKRLSQRPLSPLAVLGIGALFALSFDTLSQVALFAMTGSMASASLLAGLLGLSFTGGMLVSDGLNGLVISSLIQKAQRGSLVLSKTLGLGIALFSLYLGFIGLSEIFF
jgi:high-affinity nickel-transport protein